MILRGDGTAWLPDVNALLVADLHLGKDASFRSSGIPVPSGMNSSILQQLTDAIAATNAISVYLLGDLIHDQHSISVELDKAFTAWRDHHSAVNVSLVRGNHDRHVLDFPAAWKLSASLVEQVSDLQLRHKVCDQSLATNSMSQIGGHWHPVVSFGRGADRMRCRCFVVTKRSLTLPAFGAFKGGMLQDRNRGTDFFPIQEGKIWKLPSSVAPS